MEIRAGIAAVLPAEHKAGLQQGRTQEQVQCDDKVPGMLHVR
jgi:hypothetical protein